MYLATGQEQAAKEDGWFDDVAPIIDKLAVAWQATRPQQPTFWDRNKWLIVGGILVTYWHLFLRKR